MLNVGRLGRGAIRQRPRKEIVLWMAANPAWSDHFAVRAFNSENLRSASGARQSVLSCWTWEPFCLASRNGTSIDDYQPKHVPSLH